MSTISVVIPCLNEAEHLPRVLDAIRRQDLQPREVVVVDAGSEDGSAAIVHAYAARYPELRLRLIAGTWYAIPALLNAGIRATTGDVIVRLDGHSVPAPDYLRRVTEALDDSPAGVTGGIWRVVPARDNVVARAIACAVSHPLGAGDAAYRIARRGTGRTAVDTVPFGCFRRETWERLGGFNEALLTNEDYEFNYRVRSSGQPVILDSSVECEYVARATLGDLARQYFRYGWWKAQMLKANPRSVRWRQLLPACFAPGLIALAAASFFSTWMAYTLLTILAVYGATTIGASLHLAVRHRDARLAPALVAAFAIVHFVWSIGALVNVMTRGQWPPWRRHRRTIAIAAARGFTAVQLLLALSAILVLMLVPAAIAARVHSGRIDTVRQQVNRAAAELQTTAPSARVEVLAGPGRTPSAPQHPKWVDGTRDALPLDDVAPDPWGNQLLMNAVAGPGGEVWVISAGPNGIVETPFARGGTLPSGDDIGARVR